MEDVLAEIMTQHKKVMNYETSKGRPWKRVRDALTIQDLHIVGVYEQTERLLQQCNDMLEKQKNDPLAHVSLLEGRHPHISDAQALESVARNIYELYCNAYADRRETKGPQ
ncbi:MAG: hypothetical protein LBD40_02470 [Puniceicoccales bacterium]|jgi:hypothetical protein|nr:hypothetical protein [Puniceicoccales bacterium]